MAEEVLGELTDEERVAVGGAAHRVDQPVGRLGTGHVGHQLDEFGPAETVELHRRDDTPATQFGERCAGRRRDVGRPDRSHDHHVGEPLVRREEGEHGERALIGPVEVVEHHQCRSGRAEEVRRRLEQQPPLHRRVGAARHQRIRRTVDEPRHEATQVAQFDRHPRVEASQRGPDRIDPCFEHAELVRRRASDEHRDALLGQFGRELVGQGGLADAGLAGDQRDPGASRPCVAQRLQLHGPADEGVMARTRGVGLRPARGSMRRPVGAVAGSPVAEAIRAARCSASTPSASQSNPTVVRRGDVRRPASSAATPAALIPDRSASRSWVSPAAVRSRRSDAPKVSVVATRPR